MIPIAYEAPKRIGDIYHLDNQLSDLSTQRNNSESQILLVEAFFVWGKIQSTVYLPKGKTYWKESTAISIRKWHWKHCIPEG